MTGIKIPIFIFLFLLSTHEAYANLNLLCATDSLSKIPCIVENSKPANELLQVFDKIENRLAMKKEVLINREILTQKKDLFANVFRLLTNKKLDDSSKEKEVRVEIEKTKNDFFALNDILKHSRSLEVKLQSCYSGNCTSKTRIEFEDQMAALQKLKTLLLIKRPVLTSKHFEHFFESHHKFITTEDEREITNSVFEETLARAAGSTAEALLEKVDRYTSYIYASDVNTNPELFSVLDIDFNKNTLKKYPDIIDDFLDRYEMIQPEEKIKPFLCQLYRDRKSKRQHDELLKMGADAALFIAPLMLGPWGRAGVLGLEGALGKKLLQWGLQAKTVEKTAWVAQAATAVSLNSVQYLDLQKLDKKCRSIEVNFYSKPSGKDLTSLNSCREDYHDALIFNSAGALLSFAPGISPAILALHKKRYAVSLVSQNAKVANIGEELKNNALKRNEWAREFKTMDQGSFTYMDLSKLNQVNDPKLLTLPSNYWKYVGEVYSERLNLTPDEIKGFIKSSEAFTDRTKLIVNTKAGVANAESGFQGGVGVVVSDSASNLLPVEKSIGSVMPRKSGQKVAEIVRLVVSKDVDVEKLSKSLINQASAVILQDPSITTVYIYTSKLHARLYRKLGVRPTNISPQGERDIVITLSRSEIEQMFSLTR